MKKIPRDFLIRRSAAQGANPVQIISTFFFYFIHGKNSQVSVMSNVGFFLYSPCALEDMRKGNRPSSLTKYSLNASARSKVISR